MNKAAFLNIVEAIIPSPSGCKIWPLGQLATGYGCVGIKEDGKTKTWRMALDVNVESALIYPGV